MFQQSKRKSLNQIQTQNLLLCDVGVTQTQQNIDKKLGANSDQYKSLNNQINQLQLENTRYKKYVNKLELQVLKGIQSKQSNNKENDDGVQFLKHEILILQKEQELNKILIKENKNLKHENILIKNHLLYMYKEQDLKMADKITNLLKENERLLLELENQEIKIQKIQDQMIIQNQFQKPIQEESNKLDNQTNLSEKLQKNTYKKYTLQSKMIIKKLMQKIEILEQIISKNERLLKEIIYDQNDKKQFNNKIIQIIDQTIKTLF